jgi:hypothetical protein
MAADAAGQRRHDRLAIRCQPTLPAIAHYPRGEHQVLHLVRLVALELRTLRNRYPKHLRLRRNPWHHLAAAAAFCPLAAAFRLSRILHAAWLDRRATLQTLQPGNLVALRRHDPLQFSQFAQQIHDPSLKLGALQTGRIGR